MPRQRLLNSLFLCQLVLLETGPHIQRPYSHSRFDSLLSNYLMFLLFNDTCNVNIVGFHFGGLSLTSSSAAVWGLALDSLNTPSRILPIEVFWGQWTAWDSLRFAKRKENLLKVQRRRLVFEGSNCGLLYCIIKRLVLS